MPPTFQAISPIPDDRFHVVYKGVAADSWAMAQDGAHATFEAANAQAQALVLPPTNAYQTMVLSPTIAYQST